MSIKEFGLFGLVLGLIIFVVRYFIWRLFLSGIALILVIVLPLLFPEEMIWQMLAERNQSFNSFDTFYKSLFAGSLLLGYSIAAALHLKVKCCDKAKQS